MATPIREPRMLGIYQQQSIKQWLKENIYLGHEATLQAIMEVIAFICAEQKVNPTYIYTTVQDQYFATVHHRGLKIMTVEGKSDKLVEVPKPLGRIALLTAIPDGGVTEYIIAGRFIEEHKELNTEKLRGIGTEPIAEGGGMDWDEFRLWLNLFGGKHVGETLRLEIESHLISRQLTNLPLRFVQGNYRRRAGYMQSGSIKIDVVLPPDGDRLATFKIFTERDEATRREHLDSHRFEFAFNSDAFTKPEEASNMQVQQTESANMVQAGKGLEYLKMWVPIEQTVSFVPFIEWLKANMPETIVDDFDQHMKNLDVESIFDSFRFKDVKHPDLDALLKGEDSYGEIVFECASGGIFSDCDITFIVGAQKKYGETGWYEAIIGWPEGASMKYMADAEGKATHGAAPTKEAARNAGQPQRPGRDEMRLSLYATNGNKRGESGIRKLQPSQTMMDWNHFVSWFTSNATDKDNLHTAEALNKLILQSPAMRNHGDAELCFFATVPLHAQMAAAVVGRGDPNISGYLDVAVVKEVASSRGEYRQVGLFNFTTRAVTCSQPVEVVEFIDTYIHPVSRGVAAVEFDADQAYSFAQLADLFKGFDRDGATNLVKYQTAIRSILRRLYGNEGGPHLYLKLVRATMPSLNDGGAVESGKIVVKVFDTYQGVDNNAPLVSFDLITGLSSDQFVNRNVEIIQGVVCQAEVELEERTKAAREQARVQTLAAIGSPIEVVVTGTPSVTEDGMKKMIKSLTSMQTGSFEFFHNVVMGVLPMVSAELADRIHGFLEHLVNTYGKTMSPAEYDFKFDDGVELTIDVREDNGNHLHFGIKL